MRSAHAIAFDYRPSSLLALVIICMTASAVVATALSGLVWQWCVALSLLAVALGGMVLYRHLRSGYHRIAHGAGGWTLIDGQGRDHPASLLASVQRGWLLVLEFGSESLPRTRFILATDNCDADLRRRLLLVLAAGEPKQRAEQGG